MKGGERHGCCRRGHVPLSKDLQKPAIEKAEQPVLLSSRPDERPWDSFQGSFPRREMPTVESESCAEYDDDRRYDNDSSVSKRSGQIVRAETQLPQGFATAHVSHGAKPKIQEGDERSGAGESFLPAPDVREQDRDHDSDLCQRGDSSGCLRCHGHLRRVSCLARAEASARQV
jgi:hypothetical protein